MPPRVARRVLRCLALGALLGGVLGCSFPDRAHEGTAPRLYVADAAAGRLLVLDPSGRRVQQVSLGAAPAQAAPGWRGGVVALPIPPLAGGDALGLLFVSRVEEGPTQPAAARWSASSTPLGRPVRDALLSADGGRHAAVVHHAAERVTAEGPAAPMSACRLLLVDLALGRVANELAVCGAQERVVGLALEETPAGPVAYLSIQQVSSQGRLRGRIVALDPHGVVLASRVLEGAPGRLVLGPAGPGGERRLYVAETLTIPEETDPVQSYSGRVVRLAPETLDLDAQHPLDLSPGHMVVAPGGAVYVLSGDVLLQPERWMDSSARAVRLPGLGAAVEVDEERVYVSAAYEPRLWVVGRRSGRLERTIELPGRASALVFGR